ncbi:hypothetical protein [Amycolatopsis coloradensis]|uniref:hypothetical protein n=1 Tax=Amycolatopsis coloradensis TaxID=76021 RepID=UPI003CC5DE26
MPEAEIDMTCYTAEHRGEPVPGREIAESARLSSADVHRCPPAGRRMLGPLAEADLVD